ncbi:hypothetical protein NQ314_002426 [Rhamnusium bicolor]|uniref:nitric-oxide synthase (NADPH) n=1 Tax=Rhamnusium bicolor TaxID=1586634 RepID=A0AAV8ZQ88_9CUCU|nr:hypothetical protein NQ314_002426 [Rhamnusium bicolor]
MHTYVQDLLFEEAAEIYKFIVLEKGHFYVCGDCKMAEEVCQTLKTIIQIYGNMNDNQILSFMSSLKESIYL